MPIESAAILFLTGIALLAVYAGHNALLLAAMMFLHVDTFDDADGEYNRINGGVK